jgi:hypothetical protein
MKWREVYVSEGLNKKLVASQAPGIYRGLTLVFDGTQLPGDRRVAVAPDPTIGDHVAVYQTSDGFSLTYFDDAGTNLILDLADVALNSTDVVIALLMDYAIGVDTTAEFHAYTLADYNALPAGTRDELVVLGTVAVPTAGTNVTAGMISFERRTLAWESIARGAIPWSPMMRNPSFEWGTGTSATVGGNTAGEATYSVAGWHIPSTAGNGVFTRDTASPRTGGASMLLNYVATVAVNTQLQQHFMIPVETGQLIQTKIWTDVLKPSTAGTLDLEWEFVDVTTGAVSSTTTDTLDTSSVTGGYVLHEALIEVPSGTDLALSRVSLHVNAMNVGSTGDALRVDDFQVWLETTDVTKRNQEKSERMSEVSAYPLVLDDPVDPDDDAAPAMRWDSALGHTVVGRRDRTDQDGTSASTPPILNWLGQIRAGGFTNDGAQQEGLAFSANDLAEVARFACDVMSSGGPTAIEWTLVMESTPDAAPTVQPPQRFYVDRDGGWALTWNARWDDSANVWENDSDSYDSAALMMGFNAVSGDGGGLAHLYHDNIGFNTWSDLSGWTQTGFKSNPEPKASSAASPEGAFHLPVSTLTLGAAGTQFSDETITTSLTTTAHATKPRVASAHGDRATIGEFSCLWQIQGNRAAAASDVLTRMYARSNGELWFTRNARYNGTTWAKDVNGLEAVGYCLNLGQASDDATATLTGQFVIIYHKEDENTAWSSSIGAGNWETGSTTYYDSTNDVMEAVFDNNVYAQDFKFFADKTLLIPAGMAQGNWNPADGYRLGDANSISSRNVGGTKQAAFPIPLHDGDRVNAITLYGFAGNGAGEELQAMIRQSDLNGSDTQISTTKTSAASGTWATVGWTSADSGVPLTLSSNNVYYVRARIPQTSGGGELLWVGMTIQYDRPS